MSITVEPRQGPELDRLITALLNATGVVHQVIEATERSRDADGEAVIDLVAAQLREMLALLAEHRRDADLALATQVVAETTLLAAGHLGFGDLYFQGDIGPAH